MELQTAPWPSRLVYALKPKSWPKLLVAAILGQALGAVAAGRLSGWALVVGLAFTILHLAFVVLLNDWGDQEIDGLKRRTFPDQGSPKTIPDRILDARSVLEVGVGAGALAVGVAVIAQFVLDRPGALLGALVCLLLPVLYTLWPVKLNYRGGGELLEMVGVGFALPWWNAYVQGGVALPAELAFLPGFALLALASALASALVDEHTDVLGGKRTFVTMFGPAPVRMAVEGLVLGAMFVWALMARLAPEVADWWTTAPAVLVLAWTHRALTAQGRAPDIGDYEGICRYKAALHRCIWWGTAALVLALGLRLVLGGES